MDQSLHGTGRLHYITKPCHENAGLSRRQAIKKAVRRADSLQPKSFFTETLLVVLVACCCWSGATVIPLLAGNATAKGSIRTPWPWHSFDSIKPLLIDYLPT
jgi:hypothetical protein